MDLIYIGQPMNEVPHELIYRKESNQPNPLRRITDLMIFYSLGLPVPSSGLSSSSSMKPEGLHEITSILPHRVRGHLYFDSRESSFLELPLLSFQL